MVPFQEAAAKSTMSRGETAFNTNLNIVRYKLIAFVLQDCRQEEVFDEMCTLLNIHFC